LYSIKNGNSSIFEKKIPYFWEIQIYKKLYQNKAMVRVFFTRTEHSLSIQIFWFPITDLVFCSLQNFSILTAYENLGDM